MRIGVTSDLHFDPRGELTTREQLDGLAQQLQHERLDALIFAGDLGVSLRAFEQAIEAFSSLGVPLAVVAGNQDIWYDREVGASSEGLLSGALEAAASRAGAVWLEAASLRVGDVEVVGSLGWYDYACAERDGGICGDDVARVCRLVCDDSYRTGWAHDDRALAARLGDGLMARVQSASKRVERLLVVTHVPVLEAQLVRKPHDERWSLRSAFFGNLSLGEKLMAEPRVHTIVSGHTHQARDTMVVREGASPLRAVVVGSSYRAPSYVVVDI